MFNSREIANLIWGLIILLILLCSGTIRKSIIGIVKSLFNKHFAYGYIIAIHYILVCIWILYKIKVWDLSLIKDTIMWGLFVALPLMFKAVKTDIFKKFTKEIIKPLIAFSVIFEYIYGLYTFDWRIELLLIPLGIVIGGMLAYNENKREHRNTYNLLKWISTFLGLISFAFITAHFYNHYIDYINRLILMQFLVPLFLSLMFLPLLYSISMYTQYENSFISLKWHLNAPDVFKYTMRKAMILFNVDLEGMERLKKLIFAKNLQTRQEIDQAIALIKSLQKAQRNPPKININLGWSPYKVKDILNSKGIQMSNYNNNYEDEFCSISNYFSLTDDPFFPDTITYMVSGKELAATELHLGLKIFNGAINNTASHFKLLEFAEIIYENAFGEQLPESIKKRIIVAKNYAINEKLAKISIEKHLWTNNTKGYSMDFKITHNQHNK